MSYDISLVHRDGSSATVSTPFLPRGGTVPAQVCPTTGQLIPCETQEASINITYNYSSYFYEATKDDIRFLINHENTGIRGLYGKTARESIPMLSDMISRIQREWMNDDGTWKTTERTNPQTHEAYVVSEGDTSDYWTATAANAILSLRQMLQMAVDCMLQDVIWDGD